MKLYDCAIAPNPRQPRNVELVEEVVDLARRLGRPIATPAQAAEIMNLPSYPVRFAAAA